MSNYTPEIREPNLGVDPQKLSQQDPRTMRNLERICIACEAKGECRQPPLAMAKPCARF